MVPLFPVQSREWQNGSDCQQNCLELHASAYQLIGFETFHCEKHTGFRCLCFLVLCMRQRCHERVMLGALPSNSICTLRKQRGSTGQTDMANMRPSWLPLVCLISSGHRAPRLTKYTLADWTQAQAHKFACSAGSQAAWCNELIEQGLSWLVALSRNQWLLTGWALLRSIQRVELA